MIGSDRHTNICLSMIEFLSITPPCLPPLRRPPSVFGSLCCLHRRCGRSAFESQIPNKLPAQAVEPLDIQIRRGRKTRGVSGSGTSPTADVTAK